MLNAAEMPNFATITRPGMIHLFCSCVFHPQTQIKSAPVVAILYDPIRVYLMPRYRTTKPETTVEIRSPKAEAYVFTKRLPGRYFNSNEIM